MTLDLLGKADGRDWADRVQEQLYLAGGRPENQRPHDDPKGIFSLFSCLLRAKTYPSESSRNTRPYTNGRSSRPMACCFPSAKLPTSSASPASTLHRWLQDGFIAGEQDTAGAPGRIRVNDQIRVPFVEKRPPAGWPPMLEATMALGASRQTVLQRVKRGELQAVHVRNGRRKGGLLIS